MNVSVLLSLARYITTEAMDELTKKAPDYAPDDVCFVDLIQQCAEADIARPEVLLWALLSKHMTGIRAYCVKGELKSETLHNRAIDAINFLAIVYIWALQSAPILLSVRTHFQDAPCECPRHLNDICPRCRVLGWFERYHPNFRMVSTSTPV